MKIKYNLGQRCMAYILLVSLLSQSCYSPSLLGGPNKQTPIEEKRPTTSINLSSLQEETDQEEQEIFTKSKEESMTLELVPSIPAGGLLSPMEEVKQVKLALSPYKESPLAQRAPGFEVETSRITYQGAKTNRSQPRNLPTNSLAERKSSQEPSKRKSGLAKGNSLQGQKRLSESRLRSQDQRRTSSAPQEIGVKEATNGVELSAPIRQAITSVGISKRASNQESFHKPLLAKGGHEVRIEQLPSGQWEAEVKESLPAGITRTLLLPAYLEPGYSLDNLSEHSAAWQKNHIHVILNKGNSCVLVGKMGLLGGMKKEEDDDKEKGEDKEGFSDLEKIGEGSSGIVYKGIWKKSIGQSIAVAIKTPLNTANIEEIREEAAKMETIMHKNIVRFFGLHDIKIDGRMVKAIITELMEGRSVESFLSKASKGLIKPMDIVSMCLDTATGMRYLHENNIIHRDLAARNLLLSSNRGKYIVKVSDFGLSRQIPSERQFDKSAPSITLNLKFDKNPIKWTAPEVFMRGRVSSRNDLWSFGVVLYELFTFCKVTPYEYFTGKAIIKKIKSGKNMYTYLSIPDCPEGVQELVNSCMDNDPKARPDFDGIIYKLKKIQESVKVNNSWKIEEDNNAEIPIDLGSGTFDSSESSEEEKAPANTGRDWSLAPQIKTIEGHTGWVSTLIELSDGLLASCSWDKTIKIWDRAGKCIKTLEGHTDYVYTLIKLSDGLLASGSYDHTIKIWDRAGNCINTLVGHTSSVYTLIELSDGLLASGSDDNTIKIWDRAGNCINTLEGHKDYVHTLIKLSDGLLASSSSDVTIEIWDRAGNCIKTLQGHTSYVNTLIELSDGLLASGSNDNTIKIWDRAGKCIKTLEGHATGVRTLIELSDGLLASGSQDKTIKLWDFSRLN